MSIKIESVKFISFRVGADLLSGSGWGGVAEGDSLILYAQILCDRIQAVYPHASVEWAVEPRLGITVEIDRVEVGEDADDDIWAEDRVREACKRTADRLYEQNHLWVVEL
jgi:hypothetical protein